MHTRNLLVRNKFFWAAVSWTLLITFLCLIKGKTLGDAGWLHLPYKDKYVHSTFYFVFTVLWFLHFRAQNTAGTKRLRAMVFLMAVFYGGFIEICQGLFTTDRNADILDVLANTSGSAIAVLALWLLEKRKK
jgi:glycopeptide antibiotics resistance protein